jgi:hypothetical protein
MVSIVGVRSTPTTSRAHAASQVATMPGPQATSATTSSGPTSAMSPSTCRAASSLITLDAANEAAWTVNCSTAIRSSSPRACSC